MKSAGRNDPCPCGSGRKYKACCHAAHEARAQLEAAVGAEALREAEERWQAAARAAPVWEAEVTAVQIRLREDRDAAPAFVMVAAEGYVVHGKVTSRRPVGAAERARAVAEAVVAAARVLGRLPERLHVRDEALARALADEMAPRGVAVAAAAIPALDEALDAVLANLCGSFVMARTATPSTWAETEASAAVVADFHRAAAEFARAAPWDRFDDVSPLRLAFDDGVEWTASVMGSGGMHFGLAMYSDAADLADVVESGPHEDPQELFGRMRGWTLSVGLDAHGEVTRAMRREVAKAGWPLSGAGWYPRLYGVHLPERRVTPAHVRRATVALRAVALFAEGRDPERETGARVSLLPNGGDAAERPTPYVVTN